MNRWTLVVALVVGLFVALVGCSKGDVAQAPPGAASPGAAAPGASQPAPPAAPESLEQAGDQTGVQEQASPAEAPAPAPEKPPEPAEADGGGRPEYMPCRVESYYSAGDLENWWSLKYEGGRLVAARDENMGMRKASLKLDAPEKIEADMAKQPWTMNYKYDDAGRLVQFTKEQKYSDAVDTTSFRWDSQGRLAGYSDGYGEHKIKLTDKGPTPGLVETDHYSMNGTDVTVRYEYGDERHPTIGQPMFWGKELMFGERASYVTFPNRSEEPGARLEYNGPGGGISASRSSYGNYQFVYDCRQPPKWY